LLTRPPEPSDASGVGQSRTKSVRVWPECTPVGGSLRRPAVELAVLAPSLAVGVGTQVGHFGPVCGWAAGGRLRVSDEPDAVPLVRGANG
jgi:hypothetical protein